MDLLNGTLTGFFRTALLPFRDSAPIWPIAAVSIVMGVLLVWAFGKLSPQVRIRSTKERIKGHLLEIWIFRHSLAAVFRAERRLVWQTAKYFATCLPAFAVLMIPVALVMIQLQARYGYEPLAPDQSTIVKIIYTRPRPAENMNAHLDVPEHVVIETPALRVPESREVNFRVSADKPGVYDLTVVDGQDRVGKTLCVGQQHVAISPRRSARFWPHLLFPIEKKIETDAFSSVEIAYLSRRLTVFGRKVHWVWLFLVITLAAGFSVKHFLRVEL